MNLLGLLARLGLGAVFLVAGLSKLADRPGSRRSLIEFGAPRWLAGPLGWLLPLAELTCAAAIVSGRWAGWGAWGVLTLLLLFMAVISLSLARGRRPDCHCFGQLHSSPVGSKTLVRNALLTVLAAFVLWQGPAQNGAGMASWPGGLNTFDATLLGLCVILSAFAGVGFWTLLQQNGRLLLRVEALERKAGGAGEEPPPAGLPIGALAPSFRINGLDSRTITLETLSEARKPLLLFFIEPGCGSCDALLPELAKWRGEYADRISIAVISRGRPEENRDKISRHLLRNVLLQIDREVAQAYLVEATPSAVMVADGLIASPVAAGAEAIRALVNRAILPPPIKKGDRIPALELADLDGRTMDLGTLRGRRTLLLFWNPSCGFCQQMLADLKAWERNPPKSAPNLLVISSGSAESNREQGFRAPVLLDQDFGAAQRFNASGTPSAVILDEQGRVASELVVGAPSVLELARAISVGAIRPA